MKKPLFFALAVFALSCSKDQPEPENTRDCFTNKTGTLYIDNRTENDYTVYVNDKQAAISPRNEIISFAVTAQSLIAVRVEQRTGYVLSPKVANGTVDVGVCEESKFKFY